MGYPRIKEHEIRRLDKYDLRSGKYNCIICGKEATHIIAIENSCFNGEDDKAYACKLHTKKEFHNEIMGK